MDLYFKHHEHTTQGNMAKKKNRRYVKPDESFSFGPITVDRFAKNIVWKANWPADAFSEAQRRLVEHYDEVVRQIDSLVGEIATLVAVLPANELLQRAWWEMAGLHTKIESESDISLQETISLRMIDYVQSIIAAVCPARGQHKAVTEEDWTTLKTKVDELFQTLNHDFQLCRTAKSRAEDPNIDPNLEEFEFKAQLYWCNIRGSRYQIHEPEYLRDMFVPHSDVIQELFGISGEQFVGEITKVWHALSFGLQGLVQQFFDFRKDVMDVAERKLSSAQKSLASDFFKVVREVVKEEGWEMRQAELQSRLVGMDLFDLEKITMLPRRLLDELTWSPGEEKSFFAEGEFRGWPLRIWPVFRRPFIRLDGRYCCFDLYSLFDHIYRGMQHIIFRMKPSYREQWNCIQQKVSENLPFKYFGRLLPGGRIFRQVYYRALTDGGGVDWCETDGLIVFDDHLFVVEAKGGAFTYTPPATDFPAYITSLKNLVLKPATQGARFVEYLNSGDLATLFDKDQRQVGTLRRADFRHITICTVTIDPFTEIAAQVQHLRKIGVDVGAEPVWAVSIDDLRVYADVFENPLVFAHYVEQRADAFRSTVVQAEDEFDHLGLYLKHNHYSKYAEKLQGDSGSRVIFAGYRSKIDKFFSERMLDSSVPCPLRQTMHPRILEIVQWLSRIVQWLSSCAMLGRAEVAAFLLDLDYESRAGIGASIDAELAKQPTTKRPQPISTHAGVNLTVVCWKDSSVRPNSAFALELARVVHLLSDQERRLLLELSYTDGDILRNITWQWVKLPNIPLVELSRLQAKAEELRNTRIARAKSDRGAIGRNDRCPCGSGKKYKKCCQARQR